MAGHKPEGLRKRWVFALRSAAVTEIRESFGKSFSCQRKLRCRVEWMKRNSTRCMWFLYMNCFGFKISCRNFNEIVWQLTWILKTNLMSFSKLMTFPTNSWGKKRIYCSMGNCGSYSGCDSPFCISGAKRKWGVEHCRDTLLVWAEGPVGRGIIGWIDGLVVHSFWRWYIDGWWLVVHSFWEADIYQWVIFPISDRLIEVFF